MEQFKIENGIVVDAIVASAEFTNTLEGTYVESQNGFGVGDNYNGTSFSKKYVEDITPSLIEEKERGWRDSELSNTDSRSIALDDPQHDAIIAYRQALRDWPSTSDFPETKPTI